MSAEDIERQLGITLRPWQRKILNQIPDDYGGNGVIAIRAPTGSGKTLISLLLSLYKFNAKTIIAGVRTRTEQTRFWEDVKRFNLDVVPLAFIAKSVHCRLLNDEELKAMKELNIEDVDVSCNKCMFALPHEDKANIHLARYFDAWLDAFIDTNPNLPPKEYVDELMGKLNDTHCTYDIEKNLAKGVIRLRRKLLLIGTYPYIFGYPSVVFENIISTYEEDNPRFLTPEGEEINVPSEGRIAVIIDEAHNLDKLSDQWERRLGVKRMERVLEFGTKYCKELIEKPPSPEDVALLKGIDVEDAEKLIRETTEFCRNEFPKVKQSAETLISKLKDRLKELGKEYEVTENAYKRLRFEHINELALDFEEFSKLIMPLVRVEELVSRARIIRSFVVNSELFYLLYKFKETGAPEYRDQLTSLIDPGSWNFYMTKEEDEVYMSIKPVTPGPIIGLARSRFVGPWILMSGTLPDKDYIEHVWGLHVDYYIDLSKEVRIGHREVKIITDVTSEFKSRSPEMFRKYAELGKRIVMSGEDGVYLFVYPNARMMIDIANLMMDLPSSIKQVREGEVRNIPVLMNLAKKYPKLVIHAFNGGSFIEGVELTENNRSLIKYVVFMGVPFPNVKDDYTKDKIKASGMPEYRYMKVQAWMSVMQAGGRSIRGDGDKATWILADYRFSYLSKEWGLTSY
jgi:Rad3-related DNA helicase